MTKIYSLDQIKEVLKNIDALSAIQDIQISKAVYEALIQQEKER